ncbi:MAG: S-layer protein [Firmicutes bacterium]|nr:S-layer protein [Bacillota bacterium]
MNKSLIVGLTFIVTIAMAGTAMAATNPFSDVPVGHWSYAAVNKLVNDGIIEGNGDGTFKGDKPVSRYEIAVIVAKAMAKEDKANAEERALINKLAAEYKTELEGIGVRVKELAAKVDKVSFSGVATVRFDNQSGGTTFDDQHINLDLNTSFNLGMGWAIKTETEWQRQFNHPQSGNSVGQKAQAEQIYLTRPIGDGTYNMGKFRYVPAYGLIWNAKATGVQYGFGNTLKSTLTWGHTNDEKDFKMAEAAWVIGNSTNVKAAYLSVEGSPGRDNYYEAGFDTRVAGDLQLAAAVSKGDLPGVFSNNKAAYAKLQYQSADVSVAGSKDIFVKYSNIHTNAAYDRGDADDCTVPEAFNVTSVQTVKSNFKGIHVGFDYVPSTNSKLTIWYMKGKDADTGLTDYKVIRAQMAYFF